MIVIKRGKEPNSLLKFRKENPDADYESDMPTEVLKDIRKQMWEEQRCLCAYCMKKIEAPSVVRIEHCRPRHPRDEQEHDKKATLDFKWMLGVCYGNSMVRGVKPEDKTCDAHRGNIELTVNRISGNQICLSDDEGNICSGSDQRYQGYGGRLSETDIFD